MARPARPAIIAVLALIMAAVCVCCAEREGETCAAGVSAAAIVVVGSLNVDITIKVARPPQLGETVAALSAETSVAMGGKGANQAVAAARLAAGTRAVKLVCVLGDDAHADALEKELLANSVDISMITRASNVPSGQGFVMLSPDGAASSVVVAGANLAWPVESIELAEHMAAAVRGAAVVMLQREVPERVNFAAATAARAAGALTLLDAGGVDDPLPKALLAAVDYLCPNESELARLTGLSIATDAEVIAAARALIDAGARRVLATLGERGAVLVSNETATATRFAAANVPGGVVVDATAAGDAFRAALAVSLAESGGALTDRGMRLAAAAGALTVAAAGAVPSLPTRREADALLPPELRADAMNASPKRSCEIGHAPSPSPRLNSDDCPLRFASRLNSMQARCDLWNSPSVSKDGGSTDCGSELGTLDLVARMGAADGIDLVDFNYPQHLAGLDASRVLAALAEAKLEAGAVAVRFPAADFLRGGAFSHPDASVRAAAVELVADACAWAKALGAAGGVVVWPQFDGYNYHLQVNYTETWRRSVDALRAATDHGKCADVRLSYEFKPTDVVSRFAVVPSTGAALALVRDVDRARRFGLTLDLGHLLAAGENPAQSAEAVASAGALFGFQMGDAHSRLGAEDGLAFSSVHSAGALELVYWLRAVQYDGYVYFDTFPEAEDPVREAMYNVRVFRRMWRQAARLEREGMGAILSAHDAMRSLELQEALAGG